MPPPPPADATEKEPVTLERHDVQKDHGNKAHVEDNASTASATQHQQHQQHQQRSQCTDDRLKVENLRHFRLPKPLHDPFIGDTNELCLWEWTKLCVFGIILAPVRALLCALLLFLLNVYLTVCSWGYNIKFDGEDEIPAELLARTKPVVQVCARALIFFLGCYYIPRKGKAANPKEVPIVVMNHVSYFEAFYSLSLGFVHIGKKDAAQLLPFRKPSTFAQIIQVERESKHSANRSREKINEWLERRGEEKFVPFACYPEGTTTSGDAMVRFKTGAFVPGLPVQPLVFKTHFTFLNPSHTFGAKHWYFRLLSQFVNFLEAEYLPPYYPNEEEKKDPKLYALNVREYMCAHMNMQTSEFANHDVMLQYTAEKVGARTPVPYAVEWGWFDVNFKLHLADAKDLCKKFVPEADEQGTWSHQVFKNTISHALQEAAPRLFEFFDQDDDGAVSFRDFLWSACLLRKECGISFEQLLSNEPTHEDDLVKVAALVLENLEHKRSLGKPQHRLE